MKSDREDLLLEHEVDGIREYDNPLPGWWVGLFWVTILFCLPYVLFYHSVDGRSIHDEYDQDVGEHAARLIEKYGKLTNDIPTLQKYMVDPTAMSAMQSLFKGKCAQCHSSDAGGGVGPNLTDDYYINIKKLDDIANVIRAGVPLKGMPTWGGQLSDTQIVLMASYVAQLRGRPIQGQAPKGEKIAPWPKPDPANQAPSTSPSSGSQGSH